VKVTTPAGEHWSYPTNAYSLWNKKDWLIGREICRKEYLMHRKFVGWQGWLLKRKIWGAKCPRCADFDTETPANGHCPICYGTGKDGGYWSPFPTFAYNMSGGRQVFKQINEDVGMSDVRVFKDMRILGYPLLSTNDVFVHEGSGRRFYVRPTVVAAEIKGMPVVYVAELRQAPFTDEIYMYGRPPAEPEPTPEPENPTYVAPVVVQPLIFWLHGEWRIGQIEQFKASTTGATPQANLQSYVWTGATVTKSGDQFVVAGNPEIDGVYTKAGMITGAQAYKRTE
jgi:hypothetical protein